MLFLESCNTTEVRPFEDYEYNVEFEKVETFDNQELYKIGCHKRKYRVWKDTVGSLERFKVAPTSECNKVFGFRPKAKADLWSLMEYVRKEINNDRPEEKERVTRETR